MRSLAESAESIERMQCATSWFLALRWGGLIHLALIIIPFARLLCSSISRRSVPNSGLNVRGTNGVNKEKVQSLIVAPFSRAPAKRFLLSSFLIHSIVLAL